jgi:hypothetical protein
MDYGPEDAYIRETELVGNVNVSDEREVLYQVTILEDGNAIGTEKVVPACSGCGSYFDNSPSVVKERFTPAPGDTDTGFKVASFEIGCNQVGDLWYIDWARRRHGLVDSVFVTEQREE